VIEAATKAGIFTFDEIALLKKEPKNEEIEKLKLSQSLPDISSVLREMKQEEEIRKELPKEKKIEILNTKTLPRGTNLSGGFQQSVALARVFLKKHARLFILDESTSAMDPIKKRQIIMPQLLKFAKENKITLIIISHDMSDLKYADKLVLLELGKIVCQGTFEEVAKNEKLIEMITI
jgi:ABC-type bacteriocin/lantibiotic exporter with double-glycine peptidase domain